MIRKIFNWLFPKGCLICGGEVVNIIEHQYQIGDFLIPVETLLCKKCLENRS